jgi:hypothetical protein
MANAGSRKDVEKAERQAKQDETTRKVVIQSLMSTKDGRRYLWLELADGGIFSQSFTTAPGAFGIMCFSEGRRSSALRLFSDIQRWAPQQFVKAMIENASVEIKEEKDDGYDKGELFD